jgi:hypothetical protein
MKLNKILLLFSLFVFTTLVLSAQVFTIDFSKKINPIGFIKTEESFFLASDTALFEFNKKDKNWKPIKLFYEKIKTVAVVKDKIWMGTAHSLFYRDDKNELTFWKGIKGGEIDVLSLKQHPATQNIIVSTADDGAFAIKDTVLDKTLVAHIRAEDACHCGGYDWVGTNTGLVRVDKAGKIQIYAEEGVGGFEIPDNLVTRLYCADGQHLWVLMSDALAFLDADENNTTSHAEGFEFLGKRGNQIFDVLRTPDGDFLFLTQEGLILMNRAKLTEHPEHAASVEVYSNAGKPTITKIKNPILDDSLWIKGYFDSKQNLWLASNSHIYKMSKKEWSKLIK